jgi:glycosyltransferase involved in cell wall biosynthesis
MIKVLFLINELDVGGAEVVLTQIATRLDPSRFRPSVACLWGRGALAEKLAAHGIPGHFLDFRRKWDLGVLFRLRRLLNTGKFDVLHTFLFQANIVGRLAARFASERPITLAGVHVTDPRRYHFWIEGWTSELVDKFLAVSEGVRARLIQTARIPPDKIVTIPNGVEPAAPAESRGLRAELKLPPEARIVATVGRLTEQKGLCYLIEAAAQVLKHRPDAHFLIVGQGPLEGALRRQAEQLGVAGNVHFLGWRKDAALIAAAADLFVLPSLWEGMPIALLEAMAAGVPVVATQVAGSSEIVESEKYGILVPPADAGALGREILGLLSNPERARQLGAAGRQRVLEAFSVEKMVRAHEELYLGLVEQQRRHMGRLTLTPGTDDGGL